MSKLLAGFNDVEGLLQAFPDIPKRLEQPYAYLQACEARLLELIDACRTETAHAAPPADAEGDVEFGLVLYWLQHPTAEHSNAMRIDPAHTLVTHTLQRFAPPSRITQQAFLAFSDIAYKYGCVAADGTLLTLGKYALDPLWLAAFVNYAINWLDPDSVYHPYPATPYYAAIGNGKQRIRIAILGDWGTGIYDGAYDGQGPAAAVMDAIRNLQPDYVVHLGDVYYSGTDKRFPANEERNNFLAQWHTGTGAQSCFTLNSNHEMYGAAQGLIDVALAAGTPFEHQAGTPYFGLSFGNWAILGLDSAYFDPSPLYMKGALGNAQNTQQRDFIRQRFGSLDGKKVFALTHHNPMSFDGAAFVANPGAGIGLWDGMRAALGNRTPDVWYWGHLHLGAAYNQNSAVGAQGTLGRCVGHSAIPFGNASGMNRNNVDYYAHTALNIGTKQVQNGFAVVTLDASGALAETFYEVDAQGKCIQAWSK